MRVDQIMTFDPTTCAQSEKLARAADVMREMNVGVVPVVESKDSSRLVGIVTDRDLCMSVICDGLNPIEAAIYQCMSTELVSCGPGDDVEEVMALMRLHQLKRIPVVNPDGNLEGIVSLADLSLSESVDALDIDETIREISEPPTHPI